MKVELWQQRWSFEARGEWCGEGQLEGENDNLSILEVLNITRAWKGGQPKSLDSGHVARVCKVITPLLLRSSKGIVEGRRAARSSGMTTSRNRHFVYAMRPKDWHKVGVFWSKFTRRCVTMVSYDGDIKVTRCVGYEVWTTKENTRKRYRPIPKRIVFYQFETV